MTAPDPIETLARIESSWDAMDESARDDQRAIRECRRLPVAASGDRSIDRLIRAARQMLEWWESDALSLKDCEDDLRFALEAFDARRD